MLVMYVGVVVGRCWCSSAYCAEYSMVATMMLSKSCCCYFFGSLVPYATVRATAAVAVVVKACHAVVCH